MSKPRKLSNLKINAIALVGKAANRRKFLLFKSKDKINKDENAGGEQKMTVEELKQMLTTMMQKMDDIIAKVGGEVKPPADNKDKNNQDEDLMKQVKEIVTDENIAILKGAIEILEKAEQMSDQEKNKKAQEDRSKKYNIAIKEGGSVTKPSEYEKLSDEQFADPVNYSYPIDSEHIMAAYKYFAQSDNRSLYSEEEQKIIWDKIINALPKENREEAKKVAGITKGEKSTEEVVIDDETIDMVKKINQGLK